MVQYILTPWRDRSELLLVRQQFYGTGGGSSSWLDGPEDESSVGNNHGHGQIRPEQKLASRHQAIARVSMWMQRGNCPHLVESTALLAAAVLSDEAEDDGGARAPSSAYAARAAYAAAFSRFVTGLLDGQQDKQRKQSMYALAKTIGLPATFVELRHQVTHEQLPTLAKLRAAARKALRWIWEYYWRHLGPPEEDDRGVEAATCESAVLRYLREGEHDGDRGGLRGDPGLETLRATWDRGLLLECVAGLQGRLLGNQAQLRCLQLASELRRQGGHSRISGEGEGMDDAGRGVGEVSHDEGAADAGSGSVGADADTGWSLYQGTWKPKPIGMA